MRPWSSAFAVSLLLTIGGCTESKLRPGHCEHDSDCLPGEYCVLQGAATFSCALLDGGLPDGNASDASPDVSAEVALEVAPEVAPEVPPECITSSDCPSPKPICDTGSCRPCDGLRPGDGAACTARDSGKRICGSNGSCVECVSVTSSDCNSDPAKPICDVGSNTCVKCSVDAQCTTKGAGPGICMSHQDGRCAADGEVIYVENRAGCATTGLEAMPGSAGTPFCGPQVALMALTSTRRVIVISGAVAGFQWSATGANPVSVIGRTAAAIVGGLQSGIGLSGAGELFVRDIIIRRSDTVGVTAQNAALLRLDRVTVDANGGGGIFIDGAEFDIRNTTVTGNGPGQSGAITWGGILVTNSPVSGSAQLDLVTIQGNNPVGLSCSGPVTGIGVFATGNTSVDVVSSCGITLCSPAGPTCGAH